MTIEKYIIVSLGILCLCFVYPDLARAYLYNVSYKPYVKEYQEILGAPFRVVSWYCHVIFQTNGKLPADLSYETEHRPESSWLKIVDADGKVIEIIGRVERCETITVGILPLTNCTILSKEEMELYNSSIRNCEQNGQDLDKEGVIDEVRYSGLIIGEGARVITSAGTVIDYVGKKSGIIITRNVIRCGDGVCEATENCENCPMDCGCLTGQGCVQGKCITLMICGNGICERGENCSNCPEDCGVCPSCPPSCDDADPCTKDWCNESSNFTCVHEPIEGNRSYCCVDSVCSSYCEGNYRFYNGKCLEKGAPCNYNMEYCEFGCENGTCLAKPQIKNLTIYLLDEKEKKPISGAKIFIAFYHGAFQGLSDEDGKVNICIPVNSSYIWLVSKKNCGTIESLVPLEKNPICFGVNESVQYCYFPCAESAVIEELEGPVKIDLYNPNNSEILYQEKNPFRIRLFVDTRIKNLEVFLSVPAAEFDVFGDGANLSVHGFSKVLYWKLPELLPTICDGRGCQPSTSIDFVAIPREEGMFTFNIELKYGDYYPFSQRKNFTVLVKPAMEEENKNVSYNLTLPKVQNEGNLIITGVDISALKIRIKLHNFFNFPVNLTMLRAFFVDGKGNSQEAMIILNVTKIYPDQEEWIEIQPYICKEGEIIHIILQSSDLGVNDTVEFKCFANYETNPGVVAKESICGNQICEENVENCESCPQDCVCSNESEYKETSTIKVVPSSCEKEIQNLSKNSTTQQNQVSICDNNNLCKVNGTNTSSSGETNLTGLTVLPMRLTLESGILLVLVLLTLVLLTLKIKKY